MHLTWSPVKTNREPREVPTLARQITYSSGNLVGSRFVMYGGTVFPHRVNTLYYFDLQKREWSRVLLSNGEHIPVRTMHTSVLVEDKLLIFGGLDTQDYRDDLFCFDMILHSWDRVESRGTLPPPTGGHSSEYFQRRGSMLVFAGMHADKGGKIYEYFLHRKVWARVETKGEPPSPRFKQGSVVVGNRWFLCGGELLPRRNESPELFMLDTALPRPVWSRVNAGNEVPTKAPVALFQGKIILFHNGRSSNPWCYDIESDEMIQLEGEYAVEGNSIPARTAFLMIPNSRSIFVFGGENDHASNIYTLEPFKIG